ncbi:UDP-N-acetylmuramoyl-tripeptide--D-alanyl-D-alanine ligase [Acinetobacter sp. MD2]|uniref:UDP-N-acetylmuramoyl-tripeptide--D-alanyl-D- alanine ligase n=1 Tax=Acinetobacter sp. MD2 TaxID=2600066 RepID=UPI002D1F31D8|nr:UDP-N-acetylmuramoyl-tripeptide--D-alanyl-D-alanine ligase [Acinetobacter sp. MD2]MEB3766965.1 UDP-N-acetylmuramoyl-tripeptide--D-alanyl-D-alanine ligase [Acinetobacter sp. MD2]
MHTSTTSTAPLIAWTVAELQQATQGVWYQGRVPQGDIKRILTDSRHAEMGDAFLALKGERFDAHTFMTQVQAQGCQVAIVSSPLPELDLAQLVVPDTRLALGHLGQFRRQQYPHLKVIALTGSSGKTTTKEMLGSILARLAPTLITRGNLNNDLGVPMMLLELRPEHQYAVMELGASHIGEIDYTSNLVAPEVAGILNIGTAHLGEFGGREKICQAKSEIYAHIQAKGTAIVPAADDFFATIQQNAAAHQQLSFGDGGDIYATEIQLGAQSSTFKMHTPQGTVDIDLPFAGAHNVENALAASAFALAIGIDLADIVLGLAQAKGAKGRLNFIQHQQYTLIDDTYNANPSSMRAAAEVLLQQQGVKVMLMGDIGELGESSRDEHAALGHDLAQLPLDYVIAVGEFAQDTAAGAEHAQHVHAFSTQAETLPFLLDLIQQHQNQPMSFLFKGSRYTHMETLMADVMEKL